MRINKKFSALLITITFFLTIGVFVFAYPNRFDNFNGDGHGAGCHGDNFSLGTGTISYTSSSGTTVNTGEKFVISLQINGFTEAASATPELGFPSGRSDNADFKYNISQISATTDPSGNSIVYYYEVEAPGTPSSYTLTADALYTDGSTRSDYITVPIAITVQSPPTDTTPPEVIITNPIGNDYISGDVLINATADDLGGSGVYTVWAQITNATYSENVSMSGTEPKYSGIWDSTVVFDGVYNITVIANDTASPSNLNNTESVIVNVDNTSPSITLVSVLPDPSNGITTIAVTNASSDIDLNGIWANVTTPSTQYIHIALNYQEGNFWNGTFTVVENGTYIVNINATDNVGNTGYAGPVSISGDLELPIISIDSVLPNPSNGLTTITASNSSADIDGNGIWATVTTPSFQFIHVDLTYQGGNIWNGTFMITENGIYTVNVNATDNASNTGYAGPVDITGDIEAPRVTIENPADNGDQIGGSSISISGSAFGTGSNILSIYINDSQWSIQTDPSGSASGPFIFNNNTKIPIGFYWVAINITDQAGNVNVSYRYFEVVSFDINPPLLLITSINPNPSNSFTNITVISNEPLKATPLLNISLPSSTVIYRKMFLISPLTWRTNYTIVSNGLHTIYINGTDNADNVGYVSANFTGDVSPPIISINNVYPNPSNGLVIITAINSSSDINENGIWATVTTPSFQSIFVELNYQGGDIWNGTFTITENGDYTININATDYTNNIGYAGPVVITGDLSPPIILIVSVLPNPSDDLVIITATNSSADINGNGIWATVITPNFQSIFVELNYQGGNIWNRTFIVTESGIYAITINATDIAGNTGNAGPEYINGDVSAPVIEINLPQQDFLFGKNTPAFNITVTEPNLHLTWYRLYNGTSWSNNVNFTGSIGTIKNSLWNSMPEGVITIRFYANDTFGKIGTSQVNITKDTVNPIIDIISPVEDQEFGSDAPAFDIDVVELHFHSTWYSLFDGTSWSNNVSFIGSMGTIEEPLWDSMPNGNITIRFFANDTLGNTGFNDVIITKSVSLPTQNGDEQNIDLMIVLGTFGVIVAILIVIVWRSRAKRFMH